jgi:DNA-binding GntR family transcriptional regulator
MQETHAQRAYRAIRRKLEAGELAPGTRLVNRTLAKEIGTSPIPVREALNRLASEGLVAHVSGAGAYVHRPDMQELLELYGIREALELYAVREAVRNVSETELSALRQVCQTQRSLLDSMVADDRPHATLDENRAWMNCEEQFHSLLVAASRNRFLVKTVRNMRLMSRIFGRFRQASESLTPARATQTCLEHEGIVAALESSNIDEASRLISVQMGNTRTELLHELPSPTGAG